MAKKKVKSITTKKTIKPTKPKRKPVVFPPIHQSIISPKTFWIVFGIIAVLTIGLSFGAGVNGDDEFQVDYSNKLINYYSTLGQDTSALYIEKGNMHFYGGFFEVISGGTNNLLGLEATDLGYHRVRHAYIAVFGLLCMLFSALLAQQLIGWHGALITLVLLFLSPRFLGHSLINPKDIPFACGYIMAVYYSFRWLTELPKVSRNTLIGLTAGIAIAVSIRVGGLLVVAYLGLFAGLSFLFNVLWNKEETNKGAAFLQYLKYGSIPVVIGLLIAFAFWPFVLSSPVENISAALAEFSNIGNEIRILFQGNNIMSVDEPWYYPLLWMWNTIPIHLLIGIIGAVALYPSWSKKYRNGAFNLIAFAGLFPLIYLIQKESVLYDGWRHLIFTFLPLAVLAGLFWTSVYEWAKAKSDKMAWGILAVLGLLCIEPLFFIAKNTDLSYVYFNPLAGGVNGAYGEYEMDYWGASVKDAVEWLEKEGRLENTGDEPIIITSNFYFNASIYLQKKYKGKVKVDYIRFHERFDKEWDYGIFVNRFVNGSHLKSKGWPSERSIHTVDLNGVPLCTIYEKGEGHAFVAKAAEKKEDFPTAVAAYERELAQFPKNELAWIGLANSALNAGELAKSKNAAAEALKIDPNNVNALYYQALGKLNSGDKPGAILGFNHVLNIDNRFYLANYFLGIIAKDENKLEEAFEHFKKTVDSNPRFKQGFMMIAEIYEKLGDSQNAAKMRQRAQSI